uniref:C-type lectin domain-containing protein n=1 Tax=Astatotilapia calliptera TaxID=8154 RepID=A0A3P8QTZ4_ASTCA
LTSVSPLNVHQVKLTLGMQNQAQGQRSRQREWHCWFSVFCSQLLFSLFIVSVSLRVSFYFILFFNFYIFYESGEVHIVHWPNGSFYKCEEGWEKHGGKCYYFCNSQSSWKQSRDKCRAKGGDLVKIDSREEQAFLERRVRELMKEAEDKFWIGLTDSAVEGRWLWVDGSLLDESLKFWAGKEPNNVTEGDPDGEDCVRMGEEYENKDLKCWFDQSCSKPQRSISMKKNPPHFGFH